MSPQQNKQEGRRQFLKIGTLMGAAALSSPIMDIPGQPKKKPLRSQKKHQKLSLPRPEHLETGKAACRLRLLAWDVWE